MGSLLATFLLVPLLGCMFVLFSQKHENNGYNVALFTLSANILLILRMLSLCETMDTEFLYSYQWLTHPNVKFILGIDIFSLILLLGIYISIIIGMTGLSSEQRRNKSLQILTLYFIWNMEALLVAKDIILFYVFFTGMLLPLFWLICLHGSFKKISSSALFFLFNFAGCLLLLISVLLVYRYNHSSILLSAVGILDIPKHAQLIVVGGICGAFISRIPIWPLHNWISFIYSDIKNPLLYIIMSTMPLTGVYGFIRFGQIMMSDSIYTFVPIIETFCVLTMLFIALIGLSHRNFLQKLFSYSTIYYLLFLMSKLLLTNKYQMNMAYSLFIFLIVNASLAVLDLFAENAREESGSSYCGILAYMPRLANLFIFFVLIAVGLPISSMFWNNFILISALFRESFMTGIWVMTSISLIGMALIYELYIMCDNRFKLTTNEIIYDISDTKLAFFAGITVILFLSFFNPLWFVF
ncbi:MAG: hypothetical protein MJ212_04880 [Alphaproteobacteria bacterium]|nr:hypothetical protein [Alphaproteobacteria bacterium]